MYHIEQQSQQILFDNIYMYLNLILPFNTTKWNGIYKMTLIQFSLLIFFNPVISPIVYVFVYIYILETVILFQDYLMNRKFMMNLSIVYFKKKSSTVNEIFRYKAKNIYRH